MGIMRYHQQAQKYQAPPAKKLVSRLVIVFLVTFAIWTAFSPYGLWQYYQVSRELKELRQNNQKAAEENRAILIQIARLQNDPDYIEEIARRDFGLLKKNELLFDFRPQSR